MNAEASGTDQHAASPHPAPEHAKGRARDPVCGMTVDPHNPKGGKADYRGHPYYFCSAGCRTKFVADPGKYLGEREPEPVVEGAVYTCPMHPEIRQEGPGSCPICGMALERCWSASKPRRIPN